MLYYLFLTVAGFALLAWGADRFSEGAGGTARLLGIPPVIIGLTIVAFATSAPEIMFSISAARAGLTDMAVGNAIGSNIANVGLVLGVAAILTPLRPDSTATLRTETLLLLAITVAVPLLFIDHSLDRSDSLFLLAGLIAFMLMVIRSANRLPANDSITKELAGEIPAAIGKGRALIMLLLGFAVLLGGAEILVTGAEGLAIYFGISDVIIGLTIVAIGTSLPELAVSIISALKGEAGIAIGSVIGSNVFNLLAVIGVAGLVGPAALDPKLLQLHYPVLLAFTLVLLRLTYNPFGKPGIGRGLGFSLLAAFLGYQAFLLSTGQ